MEARDTAVNLGRVLLNQAATKLVENGGKISDDLKKPKNPGPLLRLLEQAIREQHPSPNSNPPRCQQEDASSSRRGQANDAEDVRIMQFTSPLRLAGLLSKAIYEDPTTAAAVVQYMQYKARQPAGLGPLTTARCQPQLFELLKAAARHLQQLVGAGLAAAAPISTTATTAAAAGQGGGGGGSGGGSKPGSNSSKHSSNNSNPSKSADPSTTASSSSSSMSGQASSWASGPPLDTWLHPLLRQLHPAHVLQLTAQLLLYLAPGEEEDSSRVPLLPGTSPPTAAADTPLHGAVLVSLLALVQQQLVASRGLLDPSSLPEILLSHQPQQQPQQEEEEEAGSTQQAGKPGSAASQMHQQQQHNMHRRQEGVEAPGGQEEVSLYAPVFTFGLLPEGLLLGPAATPAPTPTAANPPTAQLPPMAESGHPAPPMQQQQQPGVSTKSQRPTAAAAGSGEQQPGTSNQQEAVGGVGVATPGRPSFPNPHLQLLAAAKQAAAAGAGAEAAAAADDDVVGSDQQQVPGYKGPLNAHTHQLQRGLAQVQQKMTHPTPTTDSAMMMSSSSASSSRSGSADSTHATTPGRLVPGLRVGLPGSTPSQRVAAAAAEEATAADVAAVAGRMEQQQRAQLMARRHLVLRAQGPQLKGKQTHNHSQQQQKDQGTAEKGTSSIRPSSATMPPAPLPPPLPRSAVVGHMAAAGGVLVATWLTQHERALLLPSPARLLSSTAALAQLAQQATLTVAARGLGGVEAPSLTGALEAPPPAAAVSVQGKEGNLLPAATTTSSSSSSKGQEGGGASSSGKKGSSKGKKHAAKPAPSPVSQAAAPPPAAAADTGEDIESLLHSPAATAARQQAATAAVHAAAATCYTGLSGVSQLLAGVRAGRTRHLVSLVDLGLTKLSGACAEVEAEAAWQSPPTAGGEQDSAEPPSSPTAAAAAAAAAAGGGGTAGTAATPPQTPPRRAGRGGAAAAAGGSSSSSSAAAQEAALKSATHLVTWLRPKLPSLRYQVQLIVERLQRDKGPDKSIQDVLLCPPLTSLVESVARDDGLAALLASPQLPAPQQLLLLLMRLELCAQLFTQARDGLSGMPQDIWSTQEAAEAVAAGKLDEMKEQVETIRCVLQAARHMFGMASLLDDSHTHTASRLLQLQTCRPKFWQPFTALLIPTLTTLKAAGTSSSSSRGNNSKAKGSGSTSTSSSRRRAAPATTSRQQQQQQEVAVQHARGIAWGGWAVVRAMCEGPGAGACLPRQLVKTVDKLAACLPELPKLGKLSNVLASHAADNIRQGAADRLVELLRLDVPPADTTAAGAGEAAAAAGGGSGYAKAAADEEERAWLMQRAARNSNNRNSSSSGGGGNGQPTAAAAPLPVQQPGPSAGTQSLLNSTSELPESGSPGPVLRLKGGVGPVEKRMKTVLLWRSTSPQAQHQQQQRQVVKEEEEEDEEEVETVSRHKGQQANRQHQQQQQHQLQQQGCKVQVVEDKEETLPGPDQGQQGQGEDRHHHHLQQQQQQQSQEERDEQEGQMTPQQRLQQLRYQQGWKRRQQRQQRQQRVVVKEEEEEEEEADISNLGQDAPGSGSGEDVWQREWGAITPHIASQLQQPHQQWHPLQSPVSPQQCDHVGEQQQQPLQPAYLSLLQGQEDAGEQMQQQQQQQQPSGRSSLQQLLGEDVEEQLYERKEVVPLHQGLPSRLHVLLQQQGEGEEEEEDLLQWQDIEEEAEVEVEDGGMNPQQLHALREMQLQGGEDWGSSFVAEIEAATAAARAESAPEASSSSSSHVTFTHSIRIRRQAEVEGAAAPPGSSNNRHISISTSISNSSLGAGSRATMAAPPHHSSSNSSSRAGVGLFAAQRGPRRACRSTISSTVHAGVTPTPSAPPYPNSSSSGGGIIAGEAAPDSNQPVLDKRLEAVCSIYKLCKEVQPLFAACTVASARHSEQLRVMCLLLSKQKGVPATQQQPWKEAEAQEAEVGHRMAFTLGNLGLARGKLERELRGVGRVTPKQLSRVQKWANQKMPHSRQRGVPAHEVQYPDIPWVDSEEEEEEEEPEFDLSWSYASLSRSSASDTRPWSQRPLQVLEEGPEEWLGGVQVPVVLVKGVRAVTEEQLPMALCEAAADFVPPNKSAVAAVFRHARTHEAQTGLWLEQADAAVAVCLQALAAAGLLPPCWEGTGYGEPAEAAGESGTGCLAVPLGCRQLVALMQEKTKDQVIEVTQQVLRGASSRLPITRLQQQLVGPGLPRTFLLCQPVDGVTRGSHPGDTPQAPVHGRVTQVPRPAASSSTTTSSSSQVDALPSHLRTCIGLCTQPFQLSVSLNPAGIGSSAFDLAATLHTACARWLGVVGQCSPGLSSSEVELTVDGNSMTASGAAAGDAAASGPGVASGEQLLQGPSAQNLQQLLEAAHGMCAAAEGMLPVDAGELWRPAPAWQRLLGRRVAGDTLTAQLARTLNVLTGCDWCPSGDARDGLTSSTQGKAAPAAAAATAGRSAKPTCPLTKSSKGPTPSSSTSSSSSSSAAGGGLGTGACGGGPVTLQQLGRAARLALAQQDATGVSTLEWLVIGEALTSTPPASGHTHTLSAISPGPPQTITLAAWQQLLRAVPSGTGMALGAGSSSRTSSSDCGVAGLEVHGWHCFDEGATPAVLAAALWDGGAGAAFLAAGGAAPAALTGQPATAATSGAGSQGGDAAAASNGADATSLGWPAAVYLPVSADATPPSTLLHLAGAWHAAMGASSTPYTCARGRAAAVVTALAALGRPWSRQAAATLPVLTTQAQAAGGKAAPGAEPATGMPGWGQLWWPQDDACDGCGKVLGGKVAVVCPECRVARYCSLGCEGAAQRGGAHPWEGCRLLAAWRGGEWDTVEGLGA